MDQFEVLKIENQLCFPLYACAKEVVRKYTPYLDKINLTYTQYITMMVLWEYGQMNVKELGEWLYLDSETLSPLLKKLESKGLISRERSRTDERQMTVEPTEKGMELRKQAVTIPAEVGQRNNKMSDIEGKDSPEMYLKTIYLINQEKTTAAMLIFPGGSAFPKPASLWQSASLKKKAFWK